MLRLLKRVPAGSRLLSTLVPQAFQKSVQRAPVSLLNTTTTTINSYKTEITPLQFKLLEHYKTALIIPSTVAEQLQNICEPEKTEEIRADSVLRKRRLKMKKHKLRKRRKAQRALRRKLKKD